MTTTNTLRLDAIVASKTNPRKHFDKTALQELAESIAKHGVLQAILVRPNGADGKFELVAGERRLRAAKAAGLAEIPVMIRELADAEVLEIQVVENLQRSDLHPIEEAEGYEALLKCHHQDGTKYTVDDIAAKVGKSRSYVYSRLKYADLGKEAREAFFDGKLNESTALYVARIPVPALQKKAAQEIAKGWGGNPMSARDAAEHIRRNYMLQLDRAPFPTGDAELLKGVPTCTACPKRTGNQPELFGDVKSADVCTDPDCFDAKRGAQVVRLTKVAKEKGQEVIAGAAAKKLIPYRGSDPKGYIPLDRDEYTGNGKHKKVRALLGKDMPPITLIENPHTGEMIEAVKEKDAAPLLKAALPKSAARNLNTKTPREQEAEKKHRAKERLESETRRTIHFALREKAAAAGLGLEDLRLVTGYIWDRTWHDFQKLIVGWWFKDDEAASEKAKKKPAARDRINELTKRIPAMDGADCFRLLLDCTLAAAVQGSANGYLSNAKATDLIDAATRHQVDAKAITKTLADAAAEKVKPAKTMKKTPAKAPKPTKASSTKAKRAPPRRPLASFMKPMQPDAVLGAVIGDKPRPRTKITSAL